jgi:predicted ABC-type ATPase
MTSFVDSLPLDRRPLLVAIAGPNGAGKTTFYRAFLDGLGLPYVNADALARDLQLGAYEAAALAAETRAALVKERDSFIFETVFSDPAGDKLAFLRDAAARGYTVVLVFIGLTDAALSESRVAQRVLGGGHDVPTEKLAERFPRTLENLRRATHDLPHVLVLDNSDTTRPFEPVALFVGGALARGSDTVPRWARAVVKRQRRR